MLTITVAQDGSGDFSTISEAVLAAPYDLETLVLVGPGEYREKLVCEKRCITLRGAGAEATRLVWADGGKLPHPDGRPTHTFRSYTAFFSGEMVTVEDMTIENAAGPGQRGRPGHCRLCGQPAGRVPPGAPAGQSGYPVLAPRCPRPSGRRTAF